MPRVVLEDRSTLGFIVVVVVAAELDANEFCHPTRVNSNILSKSEDLLVKTCSGRAGCMYFLSKRLEY